jgi:hypothetical protein
LVAFIGCPDPSPRECAKKEVSDHPRAGRNAAAKKNILTVMNNFQIVEKVKINFRTLLENNKLGVQPQ